MHYDPKKRDHGLPHDPFMAIVAPRPIGWISSIGSNGVVNLAPYSFFNAISGRPPFVMFSSSTRKDARRTIEETGEFVCNLATWDLREEMNASSEHVGPDVSEPERIGLEMAPSKVVRPPRVARSPAALECVYVQTIPIVGRDGTRYEGAVMVGEVVSIYVDEAHIVDGRFDVPGVRSLSRLGYLDYASVDSLFEMTRPD